MTFHEEGVRVLERAVNNQVYYLSDRHSKSIREVINGVSKSYRYGLLIGLLAKSIDSTKNSLCIQKSSLLNGTFDARSLCRNVLVKSSINNSPLLNSQEPYTANPLRRPDFLHGEDQARYPKILQEVVFLLSSVNEKPDWAFDFLSYALSLLPLAIEEPLVSFASDDAGYSILKNGFGGQSAVAITAAVLKASMPTYTIKVHPVTQSGSSSREVSDIDLYQSNKCLKTVEVKDKVYRSTDVLHAVKKAALARVEDLLFVEGYSGKLVESDYSTLREEASKHGVKLNFSRATDMYANSIFHGHHPLHFITDISKEAKLTFEAQNYFKQCIEAKKKD